MALGPWPLWTGAAPNEGAARAGEPGAAVKVMDFSLWMKPQPSNSMAVFLLANQNTTEQAPSKVRISFEELGLKPGASLMVEDVWTGQMHAKPYTDEFVTDVVGGHDSRFYLLTHVGGV